MNKDQPEHEFRIARTVDKNEEKILPLRPPRPIFIVFFVIILIWNVFRLIFGYIEGSLLNYRFLIASDLLIFTLLILATVKYLHRELSGRSFQVK